MKIIGLGNLFQQKNKKNNKVSFGTTLDGFPGTIEAGISVRCNLRCSYCPNSLLEKTPPEVIMLMSLYEKMLKDLKAIDFDGTLHFHRFNEPLMQRVEDYIIKAKEFLPDIITELFTNGTLLTIDRLRSLRKTPLDRIIVTQQEGVTNGFIDRLDKIPEDVALELLGNVETKYWNELKFVNRAGVLRLEEPLTVPCYSVHNTFAVDSDGRVPICIDDHGCKVVLGDLKTETIEKIWTKRSTRKLIKKLDKGDRKDIPVCKNCDRTVYNRANNADFSKNSALYRRRLLIETGSAHIK